MSWDPADIKVLDTKLEAIAQRLNSGFESIDKRLDALVDMSEELETRVRTLEIHGSSESIRRIDVQESRIIELEKRAVKSEVEFAAERTKLKWLIGLLSGLASAIGTLIGHFLG